MSEAAQREYPFSKKEFDFLRKIVNQRTGIVVSDDKFNMFYSRLARRVRMLGLNGFGDYCRMIENDREGSEILELVNAITTNLTAFFRENHHFEYLADHVVPEIMRSTRRERRLDIWSAGCSTGEEPYSLAVTLAESMPPQSGWLPEITATDIDSNVLATASAGVYPLQRVEGISKPRLKRWFLKGTGSQSGRVKVKRELQRLIHFQQLNLMDSWSMAPKDVIFCRNVVIYFDKETKTKLVNRYADVLRDGGYLFIGHSESLFKITDRFELIGNTIYRKVR